MTQTRKLFKSPVMMGLGVFVLSLLAIVAAFAFHVARLDNSQPATALEAAPNTPVAATPIAPANPSNNPSPSELVAPAVSNFETILTTAGITADELAELPRPAIDSLLPSGLSIVQPEDLIPLAAVPRYELVPAAASPGGEPVLALEQWTNTVIEPIEARWTVVGQEPGWVRVIVPVGRGALPSDDPDSVNHQAVWVPEAAIDLEPELNRIEVNLTDRRVTVFHDDVEVGSFHVGIGVIGQTDTPTGLCSVIAAVMIQTGAESLLTSCQSERLDTYAGSTWATIALHEGEGFSQSTGGAISNGCVRVAPANFATYLEHIPIGTPVLFNP